MAKTKSKKYTGVYYTETVKGDKVYYFTYKDISDKKKKWVKVGKESDGYTQDIAKTLRDEQISKMNHGEDITKIANKKKKVLITLNDLAKRYFDDKKSTNERRQKYENHVKPYIGNKQIENITKTDIKKVVNKAMSLGRSNATANSIQTLISTIFNHNIKQYDMKTANPCVGISKLKADNARKRYLTIDEIRQLRDEVRGNFFVNLFVEFSLSTGGRAETILHIQKKDIDLSSKAVNLNNFKTKGRYTGFLQEDLVAILRDYLPSLNANEYVVTQKGLQGKKAEYKQIHRRLKPIMDRLFNQGLKDDDIENRAVIHTLRHTFASHLAINGTPIFTIQKLLDHSDIKQTLRYAKLAPDSGRDNVQGLYR